MQPVASKLIDTNDQKLEKMRKYENDTYNLRISFQLNIWIY